MRKTSFFGFALFASFAIGANDQNGGCSGGTISANVPDTRGDASAAPGSYAGGPVSSTWSTPAIPSTNSAVEPMSCAWLAGDNCWKRVAAEIVACTGASPAEAAFTADRRACDRADHAGAEFAGPIDNPPSEIQIVDSRVLSADGTPCETGKILGIGKVVIASPTESVLFESTSLLEYRVTCSDGKTYASSGPGACPSFGSEWLAGRAPGATFRCDRIAGTCDHELQGTATGRQIISRCGP